MTVLTERNLRLVLPANATGRKFDISATHKLLHCMKAVDFIIEYSAYTCFVEFKDPEAPGAAPENTTKYIRKFKAGEFDQTLKTKFRDTWLYEYGEKRCEKPIYYLVLVAISSLTSVDLMRRTEALKRNIPLLGPGGNKWPFVEDCAVMNLESWNKTFRYMPVSRLP
jgi:hypothetical protein|nr:hypothetical protein [uncultured Cardiobacterium sp.]